MKNSGLRFALFFFCICCSLGVGAQSDSNELENDDDFKRWLTSLAGKAKSQGLSEALVDGVFGGIKKIPRAIKADRNQAEFKESYEEYLRKRVSEWRVKKGGEFMALHSAELAEIERRYEVPARFIVAILGIETNYGTFTLPYSAFDVLATLSYDSRRSEYFQKELIASLRMVDEGYASVEQLRSSWAGALGFPQFMPSTYLSFAVDADGDGTRNIWQPGLDLFASVAKYLAHYGWHDDEAWARKVDLPSGSINSLTDDRNNEVEVDKACVRYKKHLYGWKNLSDWGGLGVRRLNGQQLPERELPAALIVTSEKFSKGYLVYRNFCTLMRYNPSFKYALAVGSLSDALK